MLFSAPREEGGGVLGGGGLGGAGADVGDSNPHDEARTPPIEYTLAAPAPPPAVAACIGMCPLFRLAPLYTNRYYY